MAGMDRLALRAAVAFIWLVTGLGVLHPHYRSVGEHYLEPLGLPGTAMVACCVLEVILGLRVLLLPARAWLVAFQLLLMGGFTVILAIIEPALLHSPFGVLSKNVSLASLVVGSLLLEREGWTPRTLWTLRAGMAFIWVWEGLVACVLFPDKQLHEVLAVTGLPLDDPTLLLTLTGLAQAVGGVAALLLRGRPLQGLLALQALGLVVISVLVTLYDPLKWLHPFGPVTKNVPLIVGTALLAARSQDGRLACLRCSGQARRLSCGGKS